MVVRVMTVAGSDSGGGAGVQADIKTITCLGAFATSAITALTAQNSVGVNGIAPMEPSFVSMQMNSILSDIGTDTAKTGMLYSGEIIDAVASTFKQYSVKKIVVDPVMVSKTGSKLLKDDAIEILMKELVSIACLVTPNIPEAEIMSGIRIDSEESMEKSAIKINQLTGSSVLVKGGHMSDTGHSMDVLYHEDKITHYSLPRINTENTHGTGDTYSAAIATFLAKGNSMEQAVENGKEYLQKTIEGSFPMGSGYGSLRHFWKLESV